MIAFYDYLDSVFLFFFFFKQKTAYEMRISDWSSDVCSSDLRKGTVEHAIGHTQATALKGKRFESLEEQNAFLEHWETRWAAPRIHGSTRRQVEAMYQIGRASCRERVCQYV